MCTGLESLMLGGVSGGATTAGLFGVGGNFALGTALSTAGTIFSAVSAISSANQQAAYNERQAQIERQTATENARRSRAQFEELKGTQESKFLKGGVTLEGTPEEVLKKTAEDSELEARTILHGGNLQAESYNIQAKNIRTTGKANAIGSLLGGFSKVGTKVGKAPTTKSLLGKSSFKPTFGPMTDSPNQFNAGAYT